jgi:hypothetical protein
MKRKSHNGQGKDESVVMIRRRALAKIGVAIGIGKITSGKRKSPNKNATLLMMTVRDLERNIIKSRRKRKLKKRESILHQEQQGMQGHIPLLARQWM